MRSRSFAPAGAFILTVALGAALLATASALVVPIGRQLATKSVSVKLPSPALQPLALRSVVYDAAGNTIATLFGDEDRAYTAFHDIPSVLRHAVLAAEDRNFYTHDGVDWRGVGRALTKNLDAGSVLQGGSSITQQLVKNTMFTNPKRDLDRKIKEGVLAIALEDKYSKDRIFEQYLNTVYFGNGAYGVRAATERYFQKAPAEINLGQAAMLAALIANPEVRDPIRHPDEAVRWRDQVLAEMVRAHWASPAQAKAARAEPVPRALSIDSPKGAVDSFVEEVKRQLLADKRLGETYAERYKHVFEGGLQIHTTLDLRLQFLAQLAVLKRLPAGGEYTAAMAVVDNHDGGVRAIVPGTPFQHAGFILATQGARQTGSSFKAITLATALENGFSPNDLVNASGHCTFNYDRSLPPWEVENYEGESLGTVTLSQAIAKSSNCAFARVAMAVGPQKIVDMAHRLGIERPLEAVPSITLGTQSVSPLDMAAAFSVLAADGVRHPAHFIDRVENSDGKVLIQNSDPAKQVIDPQVARTATWMLEKVITQGTAAGSLSGRGLTAAGKTGTNDQHRDAWFVGYTPQYTAAVWMGNGDAQVPIIVNGVKVVGGMYPAQMWGDFMQAAVAGLPPASFIEPLQIFWPAPRQITEFGRSTAPLRPRIRRAPPPPPPAPVAEAPPPAAPPPSAPTQPKETKPPKSTQPPA
jgi:penicillin-binding protein 1A